MILTVAGEQINLDIETSSEGVVEEVLELKDGTQVKITVLQDLPYTSGDFEERTLEEIEGLPNISGSQVKNDDGLLVRGEMIAPEARASGLVPVLAWSQTVDQMLVAVPEGSVIRSHVTAGGVRANSEEKFVLADDPIDFPQSVEIERDGILTEFHLATEADVDNAAPSVAVPFATTNTGVHFRYSTFIAPNRVDAPPVCVGLKRVENLTETTEAGGQFRIRGSLQTKHVYQRSTHGPLRS